MKKLVSGIGIALIILIAISFKNATSDKPNKNSRSSSFTSNSLASVQNLTLNGFDETTASAMKSRFYTIKDKDSHPLPTSIWFDIKTIRNIVTLLKKEIAAEHPIPDPTDNMKGITDGIRIYFACDESANTYPIQTKILLVSTTDNGLSSEPTCWSKKLHEDYYEHSIDASSLKDGSICHDGAKCLGDRLYKVCFPCISDPFCKLTGGHYMDKSKARLMVKRFEVNYHPINTISEWFDLGVFESIASSTRASGMRFYFATHLKRKKDLLQLRDALVVTPTEYNSRTKTDVDYFDCKETKIYWRKYFKRYHQFYSYSSQAQDNGELCQPNCQ